MKWGKVTITYEPTGYNQNYKRQNVVTHTACHDMVADAVADSVARILAHPPAEGLPPGGPVVDRIHIAQNLPNDPGAAYRLI